MDRHGASGLVSTGSTTEGAEPPALRPWLPPHTQPHGAACKQRERPLAWSDPWLGPAGSFPLGHQQKGHLLRQPPERQGEAREPRETSPATGACPGMALCWGGVEDHSWWEDSRHLEGGHDLEARDTAGGGCHGTLQTLVPQRGPTLLHRS